MAAQMWHVHGIQTALLSRLRNAAADCADYKLTRVFLRVHISVCLTQLLVTLGSHRGHADDQMHAFAFTPQLRCKIAGLFFDPTLLPCHDSYTGHT